MFRSLAIAFVLICSIFGMQAHAESARPFQRAADKYYRMLIDHQFVELDRLAEESRQKNSVISDGQPRLATIYAGIGGCGCKSTLPQAEWEEMHTLLSAWKKRYPNSVTAEIGLAKYFISRGWAYRGGGYANKVDPAAWGPFYENVAEARKILEEASPAVKNDAGWYEAMLQIALVQSWPSAPVNALYKEGTTKYPTYIPLYFNASTFFAPQWGGSAIEFRRFVERAVLATKSQLGETLYARMNWNLSTSSMFANGQADWFRMKAGFERIILDYPDPWNLNNFGRFACLAEDMPTVLAVAKRLGSEPVDGWESRYPCVEVAKRYQKEILETPREQTPVSNPASRLQLRG
jgi:hypothetical protein